MNRDAYRYLSSLDNGTRGVRNPGVSMRDIANYLRATRGGVASNGH